MSTKSQRLALAHWLEEEYGDSWTVYAVPPETIMAPAMVIGPRDPYLTRVTSGFLEMSLRLSLVVPRALGPEAMDLMDDAVDSLLAELHPYTESVTDLGTVNEGGVDYLIAALDLTLTHDPSKEP